MATESVGTLLRRWHLPPADDADDRVLPDQVGTLFVLRAQDGDQPALEFPGLGPHFAIGGQVRYPGVQRSCFGVHAGTGVVSFARLIDDGSADRTAGNFQPPSFVDRDLSAFAGALQLRRDLIARLERTAPGEVADVLLAHAGALGDLDPAALADGSTFWIATLWPVWSELTDAEDRFRRFLADRRIR